MRRPTELQRHPIDFLKNLRERYGPDIELNFSRYEYKKRAREDVRESFSESLARIDRIWLRRELARLGPTQELAIESRVFAAGKLRHIPMLDFYGMARGQLQAVMEVLPEYLKETPFVYFSGRSFHAYFPVLITRAQWVKFMGSALLCNTPEHPRVVDQRWVGHRLIAGYSALRWSWNTEQYRAIPQRVDDAILDSSARTKQERLIEGKGAVSLAESEGRT